MSARYCLECGARLATVREEGRRRRRCPRCAWTFYDNPAPAAVAIVETRGRLLLTRRGAPPHAGTWDLPGGFLESGELPERGLRRELAEELGTRATIVRLHGFSIDRYGAGGIPILAIVYVARVAGTPAARSDVAEVRWFRREEIPWRQIGFASIRRTLREYLGGRARSRAAAGRGHRRGMAGQRRQAAKRASRSARRS